MRERPTTLGCALMLALLAALHVGTSAEAASLSRQCRRACRDEIAACVGAGGHPRACRKSVLGSCKREGVAACGVGGLNHARHPKSTTTTTTTTTTQPPITTTTTGASATTTTTT